MSIYSQNLQADLAEDDFSQIGDALNRTDFLHDLKVYERNGLMNLLALKSHKAGHRFFSQGDLPDAFFLIIKGKVEVSRRQDGKRRSLAKLGPLHYFGEGALCGGKARSSSVRAVTDVTVLEISREAFEDYFQESPAVLKKMRERIAHYKEKRRRP